MTGPTDNSKNPEADGDGDSPSQSQNQGSSGPSSYGPLLGRHRGTGNGTDGDTDEATQQISRVRKNHELPDLDRLAAEDRARTESTDSGLSTSGAEFLPPISGPNVQSSNYETSWPNNRSGSQADEEVDAGMPPRNRSGRSDSGKGATGSRSYSSPNQGTKGKSQQDRNAQRPRPDGDRPRRPRLDEHGRPIPPRKRPAPDADARTRNPDRRGNGTSQPQGRSKRPDARPGGSASKKTGKPFGSGAEKARQGSSALAAVAGAFGFHRKTNSDGTPRPKKPMTAGRIAKLTGVYGISAIAMIVVLSLLTFLIAYASIGVPEVKSPSQVATIYYQDGKTPLAKVVPPAGNRREVTYNQIPKNMVNAVMAAEDHNFLTNSGYSIKGYARAVYKRLMGEPDAGGGSTITQQLVKNTMVGNEQSLTRKGKELIISMKITREWSKEKIMTNYLNAIYFGRGAYGVATAAQAYFGKPLEQLSLAECAVLAASIRSPSYYEPTVYPEAARGRWNDVLNAMVDMKTITPQQRDAAVYPKVIPLDQVKNPSSETKGPAGLIKKQVLAELSSIGISEQQLNSEGLQITTTIDPTTQESVVDAANNKLKGEPSSIRDAVVSIDPRTGGVKGYFGGNDPNGFDYAQAGLQTGSSFKVFALLAALEQGIGLNTVVSSAPFKQGNITITNSDGETCGECNIATALKMSLNTSYYRVMMMLKGQAQTVANTAHKAGVAESFGDIKHTLTGPNGGPPEGGVVLGQYLTRPFDMASAYATIAASGVYHKPHFISKVTDNQGNVLYDWASDQSRVNGQRRFSANVANNVISAMEPIAAYSRNHGLAGGRPSGAKTGTTQLGDTGQNKDAWMIGFTPQLSTAVWVGSNKSQPLVNYQGSIVYGSGLPSDIWQSAMDGALQDQPFESFPAPGSIGGQAGAPPEVTQRPKPTSTKRSDDKSSTVKPSDDDKPDNSGPSSIVLMPGVTIPLGGGDETTNNGRDNSTSNGGDNGNDSGNSGNSGNGADNSTTTRGAPRTTRAP